MMRARPDVYIVKVYAEGLEYGPFATLDDAARWARTRYGAGWNHRWFVSKLQNPKDQS